jgi:RND family efflux transporter MFP subunit
VKSSREDIASNNEPVNTLPVFATRIVVCTLILAVGFGLFRFFLSLKPTPRERSTEELIRTLIGYPIKAESTPIEVDGFGTVEAGTVVSVSGEVRGKVVKVHSNLNDGGLVRKGEVLVVIEKEDYQAALEQAEAEVRSLNSELAVNVQQIKDTELALETLRNDLELEKVDLGRKQKLHDRGVISMRELEDSKQMVENKTNLTITCSGKIRGQTLQQEMVRSQLLKAESLRKTAALNLKRCEISSPFDGRLAHVAVECGEYVNVGQKLFEIVDDSELEIPVALNAGEVSRLFNLKAPEESGYRNWFTSAGDSPVPVRIAWAENPTKCSWEGKIIRVQSFDKETRTLVVVVSPSRFLGNPKEFFPLVDGMFCRAVFTGATLSKAIKVPWSALQLDDKVYTADKEGIIHGHPVDILVSLDDCFIVDSGLPEGDMLVTQRLPRGIVNGMKVEVSPLFNGESVTGGEAGSGLKNDLNDTTPRSDTGTGHD